MRPVSLTIEGLTAFRQQQRIDLTDLNLFVIAGPTGAGKTSILDALTFALYGNVVRCKPSELITHNAAMARVELSFDVQCESYRIIRRIKRKGQPDALLERLVDGEYRNVVDTPGIRPINRYIADLLGVDFEAFTKAILLPQGRFHEFLSGDADTRRSVLGRLLELERYIETGTRARKRASDIGTAIRERARLLETDYALATPTRHADMQAEIAQAVNQAELGFKAQASSKKELSQTQRSSEHVDRIAGDIEGLGEVVGQIAELKQAAELAAKSDMSAIHALADAEALLVKLDEQGTAARNGLEETITAAGGDEADLRGSIAAANTVTKERGLHRECQDRMEELTKAVAAAEAEADHTSTAAETAEKDMEGARVEGERLNAQQELLTRALKLAQERERLNTADGEIARLGTAITDALADRETSIGELDKLVTEHRAVALREHLHVGEPCPVCEQPVALVPTTRHDLEAVLARARSAAAAAEEQHTRIQNQISDAKREQHALTGRIEEFEANLLKDEQRLSTTNAQDSLALVTAELETARRAFPEKQEMVLHARTALQAAGGTYRETQVRLEETKRELAGLGTRLNEATVALAAIFGSDIPADPVEVLTLRLSQVVEARKALTSNQDELAKARGIRDQARTELDEFVRARESEQRRLDQLRGAALTRISHLDALSGSQAPLDESCASSGPTMVEQAGVLLELCSGAIRRAESEKASFTAALTEAHTRLIEIAREIGVEELAGDITDLDRRIEEFARRCDRLADGLKVELEQLEKQMRRRTELEASIANDQREQRLYQQVGQELQADRFLAYVLSESMHTLAAQATAELSRITAGRYSIEARDSNFEVVDHENADERRSVTTLSGGETFLASLALALALSGSVRDLAGNAAAARLESMFIDEGFGALDSETLTIAVEALQQLAEERRMIGVISHVPTLAELIPDGILVNKVGASSTVSRR